MEIKIRIKHFNNEHEKNVAYAHAERLGLQPFSALSIGRNEGRPPEGWHTLDLSHVFSNQYNTDKYRVFELHDPLGIGARGGTYSLNCGYYIEEGIEEIRAYQARLKVCGYCGAQYLDSDGQWCGKCVGSEYLKPEDYFLLRLRNVRDEKRERVEVPAVIVAKIEAAQKKERAARLEKERADKLSRLKNQIAGAETEYNAFSWLIERGLDFDNVIFYEHSGKFCFGWRKTYTDEQAAALAEKLRDFPYSHEIKKYGKEGF